MCVGHILSHLVAGTEPLNDRYFYLSQKSSILSSCYVSSIAVDTTVDNKGSKTQLLPSRSWLLSRHGDKCKLKKIPQEKTRKCSRFQRRKRVYQIGDITKNFICSPIHPFNGKYLLGAYYKPGTKVFPVVMYGCESWTVKKAERWRIDAFELWCWRRLLRDPWTARRSNQSILKEISPGCSLEGLMLKLKLQHFGHLVWRADPPETPTTKSNTVDILS